MKKIDKYITIWKKFSNTIKKVIVNLCIIIKYLKAEKRFSTKESFHCFYISVYCLIHFIGKMETIIQKGF